MRMALSTNGSVYCCQYVDLSIFLIISIVNLSINRYQEYELNNKPTSRFISLTLIIFVSVLDTIIECELEVLGERSN
ncbi:MAG: hypothetical protein RL310_319 [Actinomycetota bacterium]